MIKDLENNKNDKVLFEILDYSALTFEMCLLMIAIITTLITSIGYGGLFEAFSHYSYLGYTSMIYIYGKVNFYIVFFI